MLYFVLTDPEIVVTFLFSDYVNKVLNVQWT
jgi:hypothetical protein